MTVQRRAEPLLIKMVTNETNAATEDKQPVERPDLDVLVRLFRSEGAAVPKEIDKADGDAAVDVQDELGLTNVSEARRGHESKERRTVSFLAVVTFSTASA